MTSILRMTKDFVVPGNLKISGRVPMNFDGSRAELIEKLAPLILDGEWLEEPNSVWRFKCKDGAGFHWSSTRGTLWCDGPSPQKEALEHMIRKALGF
jgi:hypothetical protein